MKKGLIILGLIMLLPSVVLAQNRGALRNAFASWYTVSATAQTTVLMPFESRDIYIRNGDSDALCVSLNGSILDNSCTATKINQVIQLDGDSDLTLRDYVTDSITLRGVSAEASPVTVIITS